MTRPVIFNLSLGSSEGDFDESATLLGHEFQVVRRGTDGDVEQALRLARRWSDRAAVVAFSQFPRMRKTLERDDDSDLARIRRACGKAPTTDGHRLFAVLVEHSLRLTRQDHPHALINSRVLVLSPDRYRRATKVLREFTPNIRTEGAVPSPPDLARRAGASLLHLAQGAIDIPIRMLPQPYQRPLSAPVHWMTHQLDVATMRDADLLVGDLEAVLTAGPEQLRGKTVLTSAVSLQGCDDLAARDVDLIVDATPQPFDHLTVDSSVLEAMMMFASSTTGLSGDALLRSIDAAGLQPRFLEPNGPRRRTRFAFVIHPLSTEYFRKVEPLNTITQIPGMTAVVEKAAAYAPPSVYSHVTGITSPTGAEAEGWLITVGGTPKELLAHDPEFTYARLEDAAELARGLGAQIMGLGAFTKVVGDAGVTVARRAPLPVTTGNSYSASGALWAAHDAIRRLGLAPVDEQGRLRGRAMVVGATGAIGSVCARLLALACDELWLVSPEPAKLLALKRDIENDGPRARIHLAASTEGRLADMDMIVTATSAAGQKVLDVMKIKPGCVITDVARPLDLSAEDVAKRPDILVIESGEIELPGEVRMGDIGLPPGVAYACLAETIVLALEGRFETFTVGRDIEWNKVKEIYRLGLLHGMQLATISGVNGPFSDADIDRVRELAITARMKEQSA